MSRATGFTLALGSVALVSSAQLGMRWAMTRLPAPQQWLDALQALDASLLPMLGVLLCAVLAYALSMLCWLGALKFLPLGRAYSLLSISYALVYLGAALLPGFGESLSLFKTLGVGLVIAGVLAINSPRPAMDQP
ncbi:4-amino-4-deoxy-L-arabinose-phosphoundecaprenol flippase subunit ArnF [Pseudomonas knackmussii]|uniref:4-amino-4-deoxy-L-arabinose-phosphoundecaprenol flippase subunit ArnF n=1 Tax=Pseudomonas knackmussii TaxID=65741 RepID=UPI001363D280|nr:4-amino-4-deoxy-L-arabinose-phosphoundecaprenol flippase subunit ArnF [Pseudomonas knackmussii]